MQVLESRQAKIAQLNDLFRANPSRGELLITPGIRALCSNDKELNTLLKKVREFSTFTEDNDPYSEHDFGSINFEGDTIFWKIDYYDNDICYASPDPTAPQQTVRVMTVMLAEEY